MVEDFVLNMTNNNIELRKHCASAIFKCAQVSLNLCYHISCSLSQYSTVKSPHLPHYHNYHIGINITLSQLPHYHNYHTITVITLSQ